MYINTYRLTKKVLKKKNKYFGFQIVQKSKKNLFSYFFYVTEQYKDCNS